MLSNQEYVLTAYMHYWALILSFQFPYFRTAPSGWKVRYTFYAQLTIVANSWPRTLFATIFL
jgi:hypothetical protein